MAQSGIKLLQEHRTATALSRWQIMNLGATYPYGFRCCLYSSMLPIGAPEGRNIFISSESLSIFQECASQNLLFQDVQHPATNIA